MTERLLTRRRVQQVDQARALEAELLDHLAEVADRWLRLRELKADDTALVREIKTHRIGMENSIPDFWGQLALSQVFREALDLIEQRVAKVREQHKRLPPAVSHRRRNT